MNSMHPELAIFNHYKAIDQRSTASAKRFHFSASEDDSTLVCIKDGVIVTRLFILRDQLLTCLLNHGVRVLESADMQYVVQAEITP
jgi:hypothetical protein